MLVGRLPDQHDHTPHLGFLEAACFGGQVVGTGNYCVKDKIPGGIRL